MLNYFNVAFLPRILVVATTIMSPTILLPTILLPTIILSTILLPTPERCNADDPPASQHLSYDRDIRPILSENCFSCHGFDEQSRAAELRLDTRAGAVDDGNAIAPGQPDTSPLVARISSRDADSVMPPPETGKILTETQKQTLRQWILQGAEYEQHWAFVAPQRPVVPQVVDAEQPIDCFIRSQLQQTGLTPSPRAASATLIRRLSLDLIGLPPSEADVAEFEQAASENFELAYRQLVDSLLSSSHYGERWGRWWLDQARYADSHGYSIDGEREIWQFRDWVINAFNEDKGFDQFTIEQIAGDLLPDANIAQKVATGFHRNTQINQEGGVDPEQFRMDSIFDRVATTGNVWLGLSIGCAQCHDHKFDPITQKEYYQLFAFLNNQREPTIPVYPDGIDGTQLNARKSVLDGKLRNVVTSNAEPLDRWEQQLTAEQIAATTEDVRKTLKIAIGKRSLLDNARLLLASGCLGTNDDAHLDDRHTAASLDGQLRAWLAEYGQVQADLARGISTMVMEELVDRRKTHLLVKGDFTRPSTEVMPDTPSVLHPLSKKEQIPNRLDLARWLVDEANPLTSRVIVNRVWQQLFGRGIVESENDFGLQGSLPTHPQLLDWLAVRFREHQWSLKGLLREIVTSQTYMQSSTTREELSIADPLNLLLGRQNRIRLDAEIIRDVALVASGLFSSKLGGPPVYPPISDGVMSQGQVKRSWKTSPGEDRFRRAIYTFVYRVTPPPSLNVFDAPDGLSTCTRRMRSNTPLQALTLLNDPAFFEFAVSLEQRIQEEGLEAAFRRCTSRSPSPAELNLLQQLDPLNSARALLNLDETITRE